jgi:hypothetical protein
LYYIKKVEILIILMGLNWFSMQKAMERSEAVKRLIAAEQQQQPYFKKHCDVVVEGPVNSGGVGANNTSVGLQSFNTPLSQPYRKQ